MRTTFLSNAHSSQLKHRLFAVAPRLVSQLRLAPFAQGFVTGSISTSSCLQRCLDEMEPAATQQPRRCRKRHVGCAATAAYDAHDAASQTVLRLYDALNQRNIPALNTCFSHNVAYENLAIQDRLSGQQAVCQFYQDSLATVPDEAKFELEQLTAGNGSRAAVVWRLVIPGSQTLMSRGISFYTLNPDGLISSVTECHEHPIKISHRQLLLMRPLVTPLVKGLAEPVLPAVQEVSRSLWQGVDTLLQPLTSLTSMATSQNSGQSFVQPGYNSTNETRQNSSSVNTSRTTGTTTMAAVAATSGQFSNTPAGQRAAARVVAARAARLAAAGSDSSSSTGSADQAKLPPHSKTAAEEHTNPVNISGLWAKDPTRSDTKGYEAILDVLGLSGLQKVTARLIEGLEIQQTSSNFTVNFVTVVPFFKVTESVPLNSGATQLNRRDLRSGKQATSAKTVAEGVLVEMSWGPPYEGTLTELYSVLSDGALSVTAEARVGQKSAKAISVYKKSTGSRDALLAESKRRNGSVAQVMQRQKEQGLSM